MSGGWCFLESFTAMTLSNLKPAFPLTKCKVPWETNSFFKHPLMPLMELTRSINTCDFDQGLRFLLMMSLWPCSHTHQWELGDCRSMALPLASWFILCKFPKMKLSFIIYKWDCKKMACKDSINCKELQKWEGCHCILSMVGTRFSLNYGKKYQEWE